MNDDTSAKLPDPDQAHLQALSALVDNELAAAERVAIIERLASDPQDSARVADYRAQNTALKALFATPQDDVRCIFLPRRTPWWRTTGIAAGWLAAGLLCGLSAGWLRPYFSNEQPAFAKRADIAYAVYAPEQRHPVEVAAAEEEHLISWLSKRLDRPLKTPSLQEYGYTLVGGRLLPGETGPAAQFMYQNDKGERLTLYVTATAKNTTAFRLLHDGKRSTFYWVNQGMGYALSGQTSVAQLRTMAIDVCSALGGHPEAWR
ncbi:Transmembrane transcriptional regulator (anti-sigma factor RsiW) [Collimonas sp. OK307]|uniref:anti-sigma factor family protein n=1 Tax=Collimonas sp. OK307 TaxID=1801620 RepID=UPI0008EBA2F4|nr:anti-sigma factor [Collimonas sp. OK307]SFI11358.1 Transmembrane transcriptional regulator (anti-sigma factor RsiW) [Collimonas sp. OK307]